MFIGSHQVENNFMKRNTRAKKTIPLLNVIHNEDKLRMWNMANASR